ncbi:MAG: zf-HC2 domain-containing protein [Candidatus Gastranaerophilales bacterium]
MQYQLTCTQVGALITYYIEDKLSSKLNDFVSKHLENCPSCKAKYEAMKTIIDKYSKLKTEANTQANANSINPFDNNQYEEFKKNLSAYIDNELSDDENVKIRKVTILNPLARHDLEEAYKFKKLLHASFDKTRNEIKEDYSRYITNEKMLCSPKQQVEPFIIILTSFSLLMLGVVGILIKFLYF